MKNNLKYLLLFVSIAFAFTACKKKDGELALDVKKDVVVFNGETKSIDKLITEFKKEHADCAIDSAKVSTIFNKFLGLIEKNDKFVNKTPVHIQPIYAYGIDGVAYYEIWFAGANKELKGWVLISATDKDYPIVNFSQGTPYSSRMLTANHSAGKVYRFGTGYFTLEKDGQKISEYGEFPKYIVNSLVDKNESGTADSKDPNSGLNNGKTTLQEGVDFFSTTDYEGLKSLFAKYYFTDTRKNSAASMDATFFADNGSRKGARTDDAYIYRYISGSFGYYTQIPAYTGWNPYGCWSGCVNNAWTSMFGWWDRNRGKASLIPTTSTGETSPIYRNTAARQNSIDPVQMNVRSIVGTYCSSGAGATPLANCWKGYQYVANRGYGYSCQYQWCSSGGCNVALANILTDGIANNYTPVHVCAFAHAYVGYGYAQWDTNTNWTWAYCYPGWREDHADDVWISWYDINSSTRLYVY